MEFDNEYIESLLNSSNSNLKENNLHRELVPRRYWINEYIQKYEFFSKFVFGKILDCNSNNSLSFPRQRNIAPQPPGPGLPLQAPSVKSSTVSFSMLASTPIENF